MLLPYRKGRLHEQLHRDTPKKWIPDYCEIDKFIREQLDGKSLVIEDAACKLKQWLTGEIHPYWVEVESDVTDGVHGHVTVTV